jgi:membrane-associated phospholipid phosphatase
MLYLIIYIQARLVLYTLRFIKPLLQITAFLAAFVTCISRISDHHHRGSDVIGGIVVGSIVALFITLVVSRVLWYYRTKTDYHDIELIPHTDI